MKNNKILVFDFKNYIETIDLSLIHDIIPPGYYNNYQTFGIKIVYTNNKETILHYELAKYNISEEEMLLLMNKDYNLILRKYYKYNNIRPIKTSVFNLLK